MDVYIDRAVAVIIVTIALAFIEYIIIIGEIK